MADRIVSRKTVEGRWTCPSCGTVNLGRHRICESCGAPRGTTKVDLPDDYENAAGMTHEQFRQLADDASRGIRHPVDDPADTLDAGSEGGEGTTGDATASQPSPSSFSTSSSRSYVPVASDYDPSDTSDWVCEFCGASNGSWRTECLSCGNPRDGHEVTYHEITRHAEETGKSRAEAEADIRLTREYGHEEAEDDKGHATEPPSFVPVLREFVSSNRRRIAIGAAALLALFAVIWAVMPHPKNIVPESFDWTRNIGVSELRTVRESDWDVPPGGRVYDQRREHHYDRKVHDGYHTEEYTDYERQWTGTRTWTETVDNGDGSYDVITHEEDVYENVPVTKTREVEDYHYEPVYDIKYYYEIERWQHSRDVTTSGEDQQPYWGDPELSEATGEHGIGEEKEDGRSEEYGVTCEDGKRYTADEELWSRLERGGEFTVLVHLDGSIEEYAREAKE